ncbi:hypothetical protein ACROYT_G038671 [Oculina patagonica]
MKKSGYKKISSEENDNNFSILSLLLFQWMNEVVKIGSERALEQRDFLPLSKENETRLVTEKLQTKWNDEKASSKRINKKPKFWRSVIKMVSVKEALIIILTGLLDSVGRIVQPLFLGFLVSTLMSAEEPQKNVLLYGCALAMAANYFFNSICLHQYFYRNAVLGIKLCSGLKGLVYIKTCLLSKQALMKFTTGHVIDLVSNDVQRMEEASLWIAHVIPLTFDITVATCLVVYLIGWQALMGVLFQLFLIPYLILLSSTGAELRLRTAAVSDQRISFMNEAVSGIRAIKTHAWEDEYRDRIKTTRRNEISIIHKKNVILSALAGLECTSAAMATLVSVITLVLTDQPITAVNVFTLLAFMNILRLGISFRLAYGLLATYEAYVSLNRIEDFLLLDNLQSISCNQSSEGTSGSLGSSAKIERSLIDDQAETRHISNIVELNGKTTVSVSNLTYKPFKRENKTVLQDIGFATTAGCLTVITGPVGCGKSTLLSAIAGEVSDISGTITYQGTLVYVPQIAWVFSGTIRENILFGQPYDEGMYNRIIEACALKEDIRQFPDSDQTVVGECGAVLSGGQRARVSLARAIYADADIYLLDDPLSAVDFKVGQHIFRQCIKSLLGDKTRIMICHEEQYMKEADEVIVLHKGHMLGKGRFIELQERNILNATVNPLYKSVLKENRGHDLIGEKEEKSHFAEGRAGNEGTGLHIEEEDRAIGVVSSKLYWEYFRSGAHTFVILAIAFLCVIAQAVAVASDVWLSFLTKEQQKNQRDPTNLTIYGCLVSGAFIFAIMRAYGFLSISLRCSERLHDKMAVAILQAPVLFFDSNPVGRILNRFSKDVGSLDELLPKTFVMAIQYVSVAFTSCLLPILANFWLLVVILPLVALLAYIGRYYLKSSRDLKRVESVCRSPVFSHFSDTLNGLDTIRTRGRQKDFVDQLFRYQDTHSQSFIMVAACERWLGVRVGVVSALFMGSVALAAVLVAQDAAFAGLALAYVIEIGSNTQYTVRKTSEVENLMTSVERVMTYTKLDSEPGYRVKRLPPEHWPREGKIALQDVSLTYYPGGPQVLKDINIEIKGGAKIGVAGRTGAGKSSFVAALLRMPDACGDVIIDDVRIKEINLQEARRCVSVLGQSPVLFSGSLRKNLDLMEQFQDVDLWRALDEVKLKQLVENLEGQLDYELLEHGTNISVGERQLICLARVLLQQNKIIILDEPTAHVDPDTEQTIWNTVREKLSNSTVITIAHRLNTIRDCDKILVFREGKVVEFGTFYTLLNREGSELSRLATVSDVDK